MSLWICLVDRQSACPFTSKVRVPRSWSAVRHRHSYRDLGAMPFSFAAALIASGPFGHSADCADGRRLSPPNSTAAKLRGLGASPASLIHNDSQSQQQKRHIESSGMRLSTSATDSRDFWPHRNNLAQRTLTAESHVAMSVGDERTLPARRYASSPLAGHSYARFGERTPPIYASPEGRFAVHSPLSSPGSPVMPRRMHPGLPHSPSNGSSFSRRRFSEQSLGGTSSGRTPKFGSLVGSYEESLLNGRMSTLPSKPLLFDAELGVLALGRCKPSLRCPPHVNFKFPASFYNLEAATEKEGKVSPSSPYVGTIDLEGYYLDQLLTDDFEGMQLATETETVAEGDTSVHRHDHMTQRMQTFSPASIPSAMHDTSENASAKPSFPGYRVPQVGQIQLVIKNPNLTAMKVFLVPYDLSNMPAGTKTFVRQKCHVTPPIAPQADATKRSSVSSPIPPSQPPTSPEISPARTATRPARETLRYAVHLQFCAMAPSLPQKKSSKAGFGGVNPLKRSSNGEQALGDRGGRQATAEPRYYLHKAIRVVFSARVPDKSEKLTNVTETPRGAHGEKMYSAFAGPGEEWKEARRAAKERAMIARFRAESKQSRLNQDVGSAFEHGMANSDPNGERWDQTMPYEEPAHMVADSGLGEASYGIADQVQPEAVDIPLHKKPSWSRLRSASDIEPTRPPSAHGQFASSSMSALRSQSHSRAPSLEEVHAAGNAGRPTTPSADRIHDDRALLEQWHASLASRSQQAPRPPSPTTNRSRPTSPPLTRLALPPTGTGNSTGIGATFAAMSRVPSSSGAADYGYPASHMLASSSGRSSLRNASLRPLSPQRTGSPLPFPTLFVPPGQSGFGLHNSNGSGLNVSMQGLPSPRLSEASIEAEHASGIMMPVASAQMAQLAITDDPQRIAAGRPSLMRRLSSQAGNGTATSLRDSPVPMMNSAQQQQQHSSSNVQASIFARRQPPRSRESSEESSG